MAATFSPTPLITDGVAVTVQPFAGLDGSFSFATRADGAYLTCPPTPAGSLPAIQWDPAGTPGAPGDWQIFQIRGTAAVFQPDRASNGPEFVFPLV